MCVQAIVLTRAWDLSPWEDTKGRCLVGLGLGACVRHGWNTCLMAECVHQAGVPTQGVTKKVCRMRCVEMRRIKIPGWRSERTCATCAFFAHFRKKEKIGTSV